MGIQYPLVIRKAIENIKKFPGLGSKSAERIVFYILQMSEQDVVRLVESILNLKKRVVRCKKCFNITESEYCHICRSSRNRDTGIMCIVESSKDLRAIENTNKYHGIYHVLLGKLSPINGIGPKELTVSQLLSRIRKERLKEIIIATSLDNEGEATAIYLSKLIKRFNIKVSRIAYGIPAGSSVEYIDAISLSHSFEGRREI